MNLEKKVNEFKKLSFKDKKAKILKMLEILKWSVSLFDDLYNIVNNLENVSEDLLVSIYSTIQSAIENIIDNDKLKDNINSMEKVRKRLQKIKEMEEKEEKNNDPEKLLEQL